MGYFLYVVLAATIIIPDDYFEPGCDGVFEDGYGVSLYITPEGELRTISNDWDLNDDGWLDLVVINEFEWVDGKQNPDTYSYVFWGSKNGFNRSRCDSFPTDGAECAALADFDRDGWTDIVVANSTNSYSYVIYGSREGYTEAPRDSFKAKSNHGSISVADLNRDGWLDLVWSNWYIGGNGYSYIYWGSEQGFDISCIDSLPTGPAHGNVVADFDADGYADIFWAAYYRMYDPERLPSLLYWGGQDGFRADRRSLLPTVGPGDDISVGDLNKDGFLDIIIPNHSSEPPPAWTAYDYSYIYYGKGGRKFRRDSLYAHGPWSSCVADFDSDGWLDIVLACSEDNHSLLYKGSGNGFKSSVSLPVKNASFVYPADFDNDDDCDLALGSQATSLVNILYQEALLWDKTSFQMYAADAGITLDPGNPRTHRDEAWFASTQVIKVATSPDSIALLDSVWIDYTTSWKGTGKPKGALVEVWISATFDSESGSWGEWFKVAPESQRFPSGRAFRYRLCFKTGLVTALSLKGVRFFFSVHRNTGFKVIWNGGREYDVWLGAIQTLGNQTPPSIYDQAGRRVCVLEPDASGYVHWSGDDDAGRRLPAGVYFLTLKPGGAIISRKLILLP